MEFNLKDHLRDLRNCARIILERILEVLDGTELAQDRVHWQSANR
jgi:hypothetical protein